MYKWVGEVMIFKKPYILLIKYFRLIHLLLLILGFYCIFKMSKLLVFFNNYVINQKDISLDNVLVTYYSNILLIFLFIIFIISIFLLWLMFKKKKPFRFYLCNSFVYFGCFLLIIYSYYYLEKISVDIVDILNIRIIRDIFIILIVLQTISLIFIFVRSVGFDIKNFEFMNDLHALQLSDEDLEEYEIEFNFDSNERKRKRRRKRRFLSYVFLENKIFLIIFIVFLFVGLIIYLFLSTNIYNTINHEGENLNTYYYDITVNNSYLLTKDYGFKVIDDNYLVVVDLSILPVKDLYKLVLSNYKLKIDNKYYSPTNDYDLNLIDIGDVYYNQVLVDSGNKFLLVYEIPNSLKDKEMNLIYFEDGKKVNIKLNPKIFTQEIKDYNLGVLIYEFNLVIDSVEIGDKFELKYSFCVSFGCFDSIQYIVPSLNTNYDKTIVKIIGDMNGNDIYQNLYDLIGGIGYLEYSKNGNNYISYFDRVTNLKFMEDNIFYFEVDKDILNADSIKLVLFTKMCKYNIVIR